MGFGPSINELRATLPPGFDYQRSEMSLTGALLRNGKAVAWVRYENAGWFHHLDGRPERSAAADEREAITAALASVLGPELRAAEARAKAEQEERDLAKHEAFVTERYKALIKDVGNAHRREDAAQWALAYEAMLLRKQQKAMIEYAVDQLCADLRNGGYRQ